MTRAETQRTRRKTRERTSVPLRLGGEIVQNHSVVHVTSCAPSNENDPFSSGAEHTESLSLFSLCVLHASVVPFILTTE